jgi:N-methylhydantoinase B/oxoprolinase/acetone carboxylase alpha subunit
MGMIVSEINELRQLLADFKDGSITRADLQAQIAVYSQIDKRVRSTLTWAGLMIKVGLKRDVKKILGGDIVGQIDDLKSPEMYDRTKERGQ